MNTPAQILKQARTQQRMTIREFAETLGVAQNAVWQWETGRSGVQAGRLARWIRDRRQWVSRLGIAVFMAQYGDALRALEQAGAIRLRNGNRELR